MVFVSGGTGLIGSYLIKALVEAGFPVRALCRHPYEGFVLTPEMAAKVEWVEGDILDVVALEEAMHGVEQVYHCAAIVSFSPGKEEQLYKINIEGTANVVNTALEAGVRKMVHVSSVAALGRLRPEATIDETMNWSEEASNSAYAKSKYFSEMEVWRGLSEGLETVIVNPSIVLGAGDWERSSSELFKTAYDEFGWYSEGVSGFVDVRDVARVMIALMNSGIRGERFILNSENWTYQQLFTEMAGRFSRRIPHKKVTPFLAEVVWRLELVKSFFTRKDPMVTKETARTAQIINRFDNQKIKEALGGFSFIPLEESIRYHCDLLKAHYQLS
jgi:dihydroflavonol-4-reductase